MADDALVETELGDNTPEAVRGLNSRQLRFAKNLALYDNVLKSGRLAGYATEKVSSNLYALAARPDMQAAVAYWREHFASSSSTSVERITTDFATMAHVDVTQFLDNEWNALPKDQIPEEWRRAITGVEIKETRGTRRVTLKFSREFALEQLARIHRLYGDNAERGQGMSLHITLGQQVHNGAPLENSNTNVIGHLQLNLDDENLS